MTWRIGLTFLGLLAGCAPGAGDLATPRLLPTEVFASAPAPTAVDPGPAVAARGEALRLWAATP